ncbi:hypothetical protein C1646_686447 [Rhizophagus diaphanus]|nr:hypothetical protein C1646_686447 [Rhizophagus diaphanus] [Rhizophagus sp. MUCL 43196]
MTNGTFGFTKMPLVSFLSTLIKKSVKNVIYIVSNLQDCHIIQTKLDNFTLLLRKKNNLAFEQVKIEKFLLTRN